MAPSRGGGGRRGGGREGMQVLREGARCRGMAGTKGLAGDDALHSVALSLRLPIVTQCSPCTSHLPAMLSSFALVSQQGDLRGVKKYAVLISY